MKLMKLAALGMAIAPMAACAQTQPVAPVEAVPREAVVYFTSDISPPWAASEVCLRTLLSVWLPPTARSTSSRKQDQQPRAPGSRD